MTEMTDMVNTTLRPRLLVLLLVLPFVVNAELHEEALHDDQMMEEAEFIEELLSEERDVPVEETPLITPADDAASSGIIDRYQAAPASSQSGNITRSTFALAVVDREPVDEVDVVSADSVYYFTELSGLEGATIRHRWLYQGEVMADVEFHVGGPRWRVWSKKNLLPRWTGLWTVAVVDENGVVIHTDTVEYRR